MTVCAAQPEVSVCPGEATRPPCGGRRCPDMLRHAGRVADGLAVADPMGSTIVRSASGIHPSPP